MEKVNFSTLISKESREILNKAKDAGLKIDYFVDQAIKKHSYVIDKLKSK